MATEHTKLPTKTDRSKNPFRRSMAILIAWLLGGGVGYIGGTYFQASPVTVGTDSTSIQVRFSPGDPCLNFIEAAIAKARDTILVHAYGFTSSTVAEALIKAHERGVSVQILVDRSQLTAKSTKVHRVAEKGILVLIDGVPGIAHNKVMIIDDGYVLTGSFNWTDAAEKRNAENLLLVKDKNLNKIYRKNWNRRASNAQAFQLPR